jgi:GWxTD domain-containing protein
MLRLQLALRALFLATLVISGAAACGRGASPSGGAPQAPTIQRDQRNLSFDPLPLYRQMGMIARGQPFPVVGRISALPAQTPERTHVIVVLGFAPSALRFNRETDDRYRANYTVSISMTRVGQPPVTAQSTESVVVGAFRETERTDESLLFQEILDLAPGRYRATLSIRDVSSQRGIVEELDLDVPDFSRRALSAPVPVNRIIPRNSRDSLPFILARPRAVAALGQDSTIPMYLESANPADTVLGLLARTETGRVLWQDTVRLNAHPTMASGIMQVPVTRLGIGVSQVTLVGHDGVDSVGVYVFVGFGDDLPIARFEDMLQFLRYFARPSRLQALREAPEDQRPAAWMAFMRETDSIPATPVNEDLRAYFARLARANARFREDGVAGWNSDRGRVLIVLGEPDQIIEPTFTDLSRTRQQVWEYRGRAIQLQFYDQTGAGRWRLTPASESRFEVELRRQLR